jgi:hypothetical protein
MMLVDEALTSLEAISRYERHLNESDIRRLIADAITRLQMYVSEINGEG